MIERRALFYVVECDKCWKSMYVSDAVNGKDMLEIHLKHKNWKHRGNNCYCPDCWSKK